MIQEEAILRNYYAKVNMALSEKDELIGYSQWGLKYRPNRGINALNSPDVRLAQDSWTWVHKAEWQRVWSDRAFSNVKAMYYGVTWPMVPAVTPDTNPPRVDLDTSRRTGAGVWPFTYDKERPQFVGILNYYVPDAAGSHDLKFGVDYMEDARLFFSNDASGSIQYRDRSSLASATNSMGTSEILFVNTPTAVSDTRDANLHFFARDTWQINPRLTITAGIRVAHQFGYYNSADLAPAHPEFFLSGVSIPEKDIFTWTDFYPRFAATYDLTGEGRTVVKASVSRYTHNVGPDGFQSANPASRQQRSSSTSSIPTGTAPTTARTNSAGCSASRRGPGFRWAGSRAASRWTSARSGTTTKSPPQSRARSCPRPTCASPSCARWTGTSSTPTGWISSTRS